MKTTLLILAIAAIPGCNTTTSSLTPPPIQSAPVINPEEAEVGAVSKAKKLLGADFPRRARRFKIVSPYLGNCTIYAVELKRNPDEPPESPVVHMEFPWLMEWENRIAYAGSENSKATLDKDIFICENMMLATIGPKWRAWLKQE